MELHQCVCFSNDPMLPYGWAIKPIVNYLIEKVDCGIFYKPDSTKGIKCFIYADFVGGWSQLDANNAENVMSCTGYVIIYAGFPVLLCSKLQTWTSTSTTEAEYISISQGMRKVIPFVFLLREFIVIFNLYLPLPRIKYKVFEDNQRWIQISKAPKFTPKIKHISINYHHFRSYAKKG